MDLIDEALGLVGVAQKRGHSLLKCESREQADDLVRTIHSMISSSEDEEQFGVGRIREKEVNIYSIRRMLTPEEEERILTWQKKKFWKEQQQKLKQERKQQKWKSEKENRSRGNKSKISSNRPWKKKSKD